ncbi:hypothetical protein Plhal304r1_c064g0151231 [Plasmopara halstedii]
MPHKNAMTSCVLHRLAEAILRIRSYERVGCEKLCCGRIIFETFPCLELPSSSKQESNSCRRKIAVRCQILKSEFGI